MKDFVASIGGKPFSVSFVSSEKLTDLVGDEAFGVTSHSKSQIFISDDVRGLTLLDTVIHECLHAAFDWLTEDAVSSTATEIARVLYKIMKSSASEE